MKIQKSNWMVFLLGFILIAAGINLLVLANKNSKDLVTLSQEVKTLKKQSDSESSIDETLAKTDLAFRKLSGGFIHNARDFVLFQENVEAMAQQEGVTIEFLLEQNTEIKGPSKTLFQEQFPIKVEGPTDKLISFMGKLEADRHFLVINDFSIRGKDFNEGATLLLTVLIGWSL